MKTVNENNEKYFKSVWLPCLVSLGFSIIQSTDIGFSQIFFELNIIQLIDTFVVCIYATIIPAGIVDFIESSKLLPLKYIFILLIGAALYVLYSFTQRSFLVLLFCSLFFGVFSYFKLKKHLYGGVENKN